jgi:phosphoglycerate dehydrogenase-like enzyme
MTKHRPLITIFTSIPNIGLALRTSNLPLLELVDDALQGYGGTIEFDASQLQPITQRQLQSAEILITEPAVLVKLLQNMELPKLKWCQSTYAGVDPLFTAANLELPLPFTLTRFAGVFGPPMAEWCLARIIGHERKFYLTRKDQDVQKWAGGSGCSKEILNYRYLSDLTLTILGCGDIGLTIARAAKAFGMRVVGYARSVKHDPALDESITCLNTALKQADYIVSVLPSTSDTRGLLTLEALSAANPADGGKSPVFLNVGRGDVIDSVTLSHALNQGHLSAAILDVFEQEPLPADNPLWKHPNVTISPHVSGLTRAQDVPNLVLENYQRYVDGRALKYVVDWNQTY